MNSYDVIVVGLGAMGSAALDHLAARGIRCLGLDRFDVPHDQGSSGGETRLIRKAYFEHPDYVPLLERAYSNWRDLENDAGARLLYDIGSLYIGHPEGDLVAGSRLSAATHAVALEEIDVYALGRRFPQFRMPEGYVALFEPEAGFVLCEAAVTAGVQRACARGAEVVCGARVLDWSASADSVEVVTDRGRYRAGGLVLTAGSWSAELLKLPDLALTVTRQALFWISSPDASGFNLGRSPCWAVQRPDRPGLFYGFPQLPGALAPEAGIKLAHHCPGETVDPDAPRRPVDEHEFADLLAAVRMFVPDLAGPTLRTKLCTYTMSSDGHFVMDVHPAHDNVSFACGFSGHGFKFASVMGEALADLAVSGASNLPIEFLAMRTP